MMLLRAWAKLKRANYVHMSKVQRAIGEDDGIARYLLALSIVRGQIVHNFTAAKECAEARDERAMATRSIRQVPTQPPLPCLQ
jgi:hypothetical protein